MLAMSFGLGSLCRSSQGLNQLTCYVSSRKLQFWPEVKPNLDLIMPARLDDRKLPKLPHTPSEYPAGVEIPVKDFKRDDDMRGPERIHNQLIYKQFGIIALGGGALEGKHMDQICLKLNRYMDVERFFAIWRVDPPWKAVSKKSQGKRMGGGKAKVHHYETPIKAGRIILEVAGIGVHGEIAGVLDQIANFLPFYAISITQETMDQLETEKRELDAKNLNPFEYRDLVRRNFSNSQRHLSPKEAIWGGTYF